MSQSELEALLGRSLTSREAANRQLYLDIARESLQSLLCIDMCADAGTRTYEAREGYSTVFTDIFTSVESVTINGKAVTEYHPAFWDDRNSKFYNSIVLASPASKDTTVVIDGSWGFDKVPNDLKLLIARWFDMITKQNKLDRTVNSKKVEDFTITYNHSPLTMSHTILESFTHDNAATIRRYSMCDGGGVMHGRTR